jgi:hypothetical protein
VTERERVAALFDAILEAARLRGIPAYVIWQRWHGGWSHAQLWRAVNRGW